MAAPTFLSEEVSLQHGPQGLLEAQGAQLYLLTHGRRPHLPQKIRGFRFNLTTINPGSIIYGLIEKK